METPSAEVWIERGGIGGRSEERNRARALVLRLAAHVAGTAPERLRLDHEPSGRPYIQGITVHVSLSHTRGVVAVAASTAGPVGIDVEVVRPFAFEPLARRWFPGPENEWIARCVPAERSAAFLWLWTRKEALGKVVGRGLAGGSGLEREVGVPEHWPIADAAADSIQLGSIPGEHLLAAASWYWSGLMFSVAAEAAASTDMPPVRIRTSTNGGPPPGRASAAG